MTDTSITAVVNPEDFGTGVADGNEDYISAGFDMIPDPNTSAILNGLGFTANFTTPSFDLGSGVAYVETSGAAVQSGSQTTYDTTVPGNQYQHVIVPSNVTGLSLDDNAVNEIWIAHDDQNQDSAFIRHGSGLSEPSGPSHKLGEIDTTGDTVSEQWGLVAADGTLTYPDATVASNQQSALGSDTVVYDRANGTRVVDGSVSVTALEADTLVGADVQNATDGQVPTSDGAGNLAMEAVVGNEPDWTEDGNSPFSVTSTEDPTYTLASSYDLIWVLIGDIDGMGGGATLGLQVNGDTGTNYNYLSADGTQTTASDKIAIEESVSASRSLTGWISMTGNAAESNFGVHSAIPATGATTDGLQYGVKEPTTFPINQFTFTTGGSSVDVTARVYGVAL